jgi:hypothetical protein
MGEGAIVELFKTKRGIDISELRGNGISIRYRVVPGVELIQKQNAYTSFIVVLEPNIIKTLFDLCMHVVCEYGLVKSTKKLDKRLEKAEGAKKKAYATPVIIPTEVDKGAYQAKIINRYKNINLIEHDLWKFIPSQVRAVFLKTWGTLIDNNRLIMGRDNKMIIYRHKFIDGINRTERITENDLAALIRPVETNYPDSMLDLVHDGDDDTK